MGPSLYVVGWRFPRAGSRSESLKFRLGGSGALFGGDAFIVKFVVVLEVAFRYRVVLTQSAVLPAQLLIQRVAVPPVNLLVVRKAGERRVLRWRDGGDYLLGGGPGMSLVATLRPYFVTPLGTPLPSPSCQCLLPTVLLLE